MTKDLVLYFSKSGNTERVAKLIEENTGADLFEIEEKEEYTKEDLNWHDPESRTTKEMGDMDAYPEVKEFVKGGEFEKIHRNETKTRDRDELSR